MADGDGGPVVWWEDAAVRKALLAIGGGVVGFCVALHIVIPYSAMEIAGALGGLAAIYGGTAYLVRRLRAGRDITNDASRVTLLPPPK